MNTEYILILCNFVLFAEKLCIQFSGCRQIIYGLFCIFELEKLIISAILCVNYLTMKDIFNEKH